eukprot:1445884-Pyramimonas_sp.AAC.1
MRSGKRIAVCNDVLRAVDPVNWLRDPSLTRGRDRNARYAGPSLAQSSCRARIEESVRYLCAPPSSLSPAEAMVQLRVAGGACAVE